MSTKEGGEKEVKEVKITTSEPFLLYMDKNVLVVTPLKWESVVREFTIVLFVHSGTSEDFVGMELKKIGSLAEA